MLEFGGAIGIDFGTENSRVSVMLGDEIHVITNDQGNITTPSYVTIIKEEKLIGDASKNQMIMNPNNTIFGIKRMIGRNFTDIKGDNNFIQIEDNETLFTPKQIVALIFSYLKNLAEQYLLKRVSKAVISVPYYFNDLQRLVIEEAASLAGLKVLRIINEPTAAALAYNLNKENNHINILVFDFGTNLTISVLNVDDGLFEIKENINFPNLKSEEFEERMVQVCCKEFELKYKKDLNEKSKAIKRLKLACERAKKNLSFSLKTKIELDCLMEGIDFEMEFTKEEFEQLNMDLFKKFTLEPIEQVLKEIKLSKEQIDKVIMVGGSSHIPKLQEMLNNYFDNCKMCNDINPDEVIVHGTAIQASNLTNTKLSNVLITFITPLSLGIETNGGLMRTVIERNTWYPCKKSIIISTEYDNQTTFPILIYEGERVMTKDNHLIGEFNLEGIFSAPKGIPLIEITFDINVDGVLRVSAKELTSGVSNSMIIDTETSRLSSDEICAMIEKAEIMKRDEKRNNNQLLNNSEDVD